MFCFILDKFYNTDCSIQKLKFHLELYKWTYCHSLHFSKHDQVDSIWYTHESARSNVWLQTILAESLTSCFQHRKKDTPPKMITTNLNQSKLLGIDPENIELRCFKNFKNKKWEKNWGWLARWRTLWLAEFVFLYCVLQSMNIPLHSIIVLMFGFTCTH
jgi:hypothetical protein